jgi:hypothetical protein
MRGRARTAKIIVALTEAVAEMHLQKLTYERDLGQNRIMHETEIKRKWQFRVLVFYSLTIRRNGKDRFRNYLSANRL